MNTDEKRELRDQRFALMMTRSELEAIDEWAWQNGIRTRATAFRKLCEIGLEAEALKAVRK